MTEILPTEPYTWTMVLDYLASVFAHEAVWGSVVAFLAIGLAYMTARFVLRIDRA